MPQCSEFEATCFRYVITIFGSPTVGLYEGIMSALFDVLTAMLLILSLVLGYNTMSTAEDVPKDCDVLIFGLFFDCHLVGCWSVKTKAPRSVETWIDVRIQCSVTRNT